jgi:alkanesulfonate monooxygenase SsuD/methylene tetrahydromethanopterin reductase-like flavin-dependent oxidoreductase (luciferase family)
VVSRLRYLTANHASAEEVPPEFRDGYRAYSEYRASLDEQTRHFDNFEGYLVFTPEHLERFVTPDSMRKVALIGSPAEVGAELDRMREAGVDHVSLQMAGDSVAWLERMAPLVAERTAVHG